MEMKPDLIHCQNCGAFIKPEDYKCPNCGAINHWKEENAGKYKLRRSRLQAQQYQQNEQKKQRERQINQQRKQQRREETANNIDQASNGCLGCGGIIMLLPVLIIFGAIIIAAIYGMFN